MQEFLTVNLGLLVLSMRRCRINSEGGFEIGTGLKNSHSIREIYLSENKLRLEGSRTVIEAIGQRRQKVSDYKVAELELVDLSQNGVEDEGGILIAEMLAKSQSLRHLLVKENNFHDAVGIALVEAVRQNSAIATIALNRNPIGLRYLEEIHRLLLKNRSLSKGSEIPAYKKVIQDLAQYDGLKLEKKHHMAENLAAIRQLEEELAQHANATEERAQHERQLTLEVEEQLQRERLASRQMDLEEEVVQAGRDHELSLARIQCQSKQNEITHVQQDINNLEVQKMQAQSRWRDQRSKYEEMVSARQAQLLGMQKEIAQEQQKQQQLEQKILRARESVKNIDDYLVHGSKASSVAELQIQDTSNPSKQIKKKQPGKKK